MFFLSGTAHSTITISFLPEETLIQVFLEINEADFFNNLKCVCRNWNEITNKSCFQLPENLTEESLERLSKEDLLFKTKNTKDGMLKIAKLCFKNPKWILERFPKNFLQAYTKGLDHCVEDLEKLDPESVVLSNVLEKNFPRLKLRVLLDEKDKIYPSFKRALLMKFASFKKPKPLFYYRILALSHHPTPVYQLLNACCATNSDLLCKWHQRIMSSDSIAWKAVLCRVYITFKEFKEKGDRVRCEILPQCSPELKMDIANTYLKQNYLEEAQPIFKPVLISSCSILVKARAIKYLKKMGKNYEAEQLERSRLFYSHIMNM